MTAGAGARAGGVAGTSVLGPDRTDCADAPLERADACSRVERESPMQQAAADPRPTWPWSCQNAGAFVRPGRRVTLQREGRSGVSCASWNRSMRMATSGSQGIRVSPTIRIDGRLLSWVVSPFGDVAVTLYKCQGQVEGKTCRRKSQQCRDLRRVTSAGSLVATQPQGDP
jgi:hypothetical protein